MVLKKKKFHKCFSLEPMRNIGPQDTGPIDPV